MPDKDGLTKREFLETLAAAPSLRLLAASAGLGPGAAATDAQVKFTPTDCAPFFTASHAELTALMKRPAKLVPELAGSQAFRGIPFALGPNNAHQKRYVVLTKRASANVTVHFELSVNSKSSYICLAQFCDWDENETPPPGVDAIEKVGQPLADLVMIFADGAEHRHTIRRRFEVNSASVYWGHLCFAAVPHRQDVPSKLTDPLPNAREWGDLQLGVWDSNYAGEIVWLSAIPNPAPGQLLKTLRFEARSEDALALCGVTLFHGRESPLQYDRLSLYCITLPEPAEEKRWGTTLDLGIIARRYQLPVFEPGPWLASPGVGLGESRALGARYVYLEVSASPEATLTLRDRQSGREYAFDLRQAQEGREIEARHSGARIQYLERDKVWLYGQVIDAATRRPTPPCRRA